MSESLGTAVLELDTDQGPLEAGLDLMDSMVGGRISKLGDALSKTFGGSMKSGLVMAGAAVAAGAVVAGKALYDLGKSFDEAYDTIRVRTGATGDELEGLKDDFKEVFKTVPADAQDVAFAIGDLNKRLGLTGKPLRDMTAQIVELSRVTDTDLKTNLESVSKAFVDWEVPVKNQSKTLDSFFRLSQAGGISVSDLAGRVQQFGSPLRQLGFGLDEAASMFAVFENAGVNTQTMVPGLKMALANLVQPTGKLSGKLTELGVTAKDPGDALRQVMKIMTNESIPAAERTGLAMDVFGKRAGADMKEAITQGRFSLEDMLNTFHNGKDTIRGAAADTNDLAENWKIFKNSMAVKLEPISSAVFDGVNKGLVLLMDNSDVVFPVVIAFLAALAAAAISAGIAMAAAWVIGLGPIAWIAMAVAALAALVIYYWDDIKRVIGLAWAWVKQASIDTWNAIKAAVVAVWDTLKAGALLYFNTYKAIVLAVWDAISGATVAVWNVIKTVIVAVWNAIKAVTTTVVGAVSGAVSGAWNTVRAATSSAWSTVRGIVKDAWDAVKGMTTSALTAVVSYVRGLPGRIVDALESLGGRLSNAAGAGWSGFRSGMADKIGDIIDMVRGLPGRIVGALGSLGGLLVSAGHAIIQGLINGIRSKLAELEGLVSGIAGKIKSLKGPLPEDLKLLQPEGAAIIEGLSMGMERRFSTLRGDVSDFAPTIRADVAASAPGASAGIGVPQVNVTFAEGMEWLRQFMRIEIEEKDRFDRAAYGAGVVG